jgi:hypothetical protein
MAVKGSKIATISDSAEPTRVQPSDLQPYGAPAVHAHKDYWWSEDESVAGYITFRQYVNWNGTDYILSEVTYEV